ncbi:LLM class flavin-dependent oxidoreductase, partial [Crossiella equi]
GPASRFKPFTDLYREALRTENVEELLPIGVHSPGHLAETDEQAREEFFPHYMEIFGRVSRQRGFRPPTRQTYEHEVGPGGSLYVGSPETVADKIVAALRVLGASRFNLKYGLPGMTQAGALRSVELYGREVAPRVRAAFAN